jgi:hypothetical protein
MSEIIRVLSTEFVNLSWEQYNLISLYLFSKHMTDIHYLCKVIGFRLVSTREYIRKRCTTKTYIYLFCWFTLQPVWALAAFQSPDLFTIGRTPWTSYQLVARPLPEHKTAQTQNKHLYTPNIQVWVGFEPTITESGRAKAVHALDRSATVTAYEDL